MSRTVQPAMVQALREIVIHAAAGEVDGLVRLINWPRCMCKEVMTSSTSNYANIHTTEDLNTMLDLIEHTQG